MRVRARLEVDIERAAASPSAGCLEGLLLGVRLAGAAVIALTHHLAAGVEHHRADHRVRGGPVIGLPGQVDGASGPMQVDARICICRWQALEIYGRLRVGARERPRG
jgi:hypothetical protein